VTFIDDLVGGAPDRLGPVPPDLSLFGRFVGDWTMDVEFFNDDGSRFYRGVGAWTFAYVLDRRAIQDVFTYPLAGGGRGIGTTLRTQQSDRDEWQIVYIGAISGALAILRGGRSGDGIRLEGTDSDGHNRWTFSDITPDSFTWTGEISSDGVNWRVNHRMRGSRTA
jgi:hypothetical protein